MKSEEIYNEWKSLSPLPEKQVQLLRNKFTTEYNFNSNHIEGNTLTYGQTELLLIFGKVSGEGDLKDFVDMKASQVGVEMVKEAVLDKNMSLTQNFIRQLNKVLLREDYTVYRELPGGGLLAIPFMLDSIRHAPTVSLPVTEIALNTLRLKKPLR